jgi:hypothetical protein
VAWDTFCFFERDLGGVFPEFRARVPLETRVADGHDRQRFRAALEATGVPGDEVEARAARGDLCYLGLSEGRLVHVRWLALRSVPIPPLGATLVLEPGEAYIYGSYTVPELRGQGLQPAVANFMFRHEKALGLRRNFYYTLRSNRAGLEVAGKFGPEPAPLVKLVSRIRVAGLPGVALTGLEAPERPRLELAANQPRRRLGPGVLWVPDGAG